MVFNILIQLVFLLKCVHSNEMFEIEKLWINHKRQYSLRFSPEEDIKRKLIFNDNLKYIKEHNSRQSSYKLGMNKFDHMTFEEIVEWTGASTLERKVEPLPNIARKQSILGDYPDKDWRAEGAVTPIVDQGLCSAAYAFSVLGAVESHNKIKRGKLIELSQQDIVDCSTGKYKNKGCGGGNITNTYDYLEANGAVNKSQYSYQGFQGNCRHSQFNSTVKVSFHISFRSGDEDGLAFIISNTGPVSNAITLTRDFTKYKSGIFNFTKPCDQIPNHSILTVGIGTDKDKKYYIIKNSWGTSWGESGFGKVARYANNMCGIATYIYYPALQL